jgi:hypothetical protein
MTIFRSEGDLRLKRSPFGAVLLGIALIGLVLGLWAAWTADASAVATAARPVSIAFHTKTVWVSALTANLYWLGTSLFCGAWLIGVFTVLVMKVRSLFRGN